MGNIYAVSKQDFKDYLLAVTLISQRYEEITEKLTPQERIDLAPKSIKDIIEISQLDLVSYSYYISGPDKHIYLDSDMQKKYQLKKLLDEYLSKNILGSHDDSLKFLSTIMSLRK
jgi:lysyl-tRNA synthetase class I|uniref:Uncharacterized protein n=1 Tax=viral metagenome TaxID=1070528 RepID=A0A6C0E617_9ZZZZ